MSQTELDNRRPIGVFDSGLGGLTVVRELRKRLPDEAIVYLGDTARVPYGTRSASTVIRYARGCAQLLVDRGIKCLVIACNTASAVALEILQAELDVPVIGVVGPGARAAVGAATDMQSQSPRPVRIGVLGTISTISSQAYPRAVSLVSTRHEVTGQPAPLLVPLVEEGWLDGDVPRLAVREYLQRLLAEDVGVIVLGCTHYPLLKQLIREEAEQLAAHPVQIVDSAQATAIAVAELLADKGLGAANATATLQLLVTDLPGSFAQSASRFLGEQVDAAEQVDITPSEATVKV